MTGDKILHPLGVQVLETSAKMPVGSVQKVHFVGIGGKGMCGLAEILVTLGYTVTGSDIKDSRTIKRLQAVGAKVTIGHDGGLPATDLVVQSAAVRDDNIEIVESRQKQIPVVTRGAMLASLMLFRRGIAVTGSHGKTSTTALIAHLLSVAGLDPTYVVGGRVLSGSANGAMGTGQHLVAEADESDGEFLHLHPTVVVITNVGDDHLNMYDGDINKLISQLDKFAHLVPVLGLVVICGDDPQLVKMSENLGRPVIRYGLAEGCVYRATDLRYEGMQMVFNLHVPGSPIQENVRLTAPGKHNVANALAAVAVAHTEGVEIFDIVKGLASYPGMAWRLEHLGVAMLDGKRVDIIRDHGVHPTELEVTLEAVQQAWPQRRLVHVFQPHRYSRMSLLFDRFVNLLDTVSNLFILPLYPAGEAPIKGVDSQALAKAIVRKRAAEPNLYEQHNVFTPQVADWPSALCEYCREGDVILLSGSGDIGAMAIDFYEEYAVNDKSGDSE